MRGKKMLEEEYLKKVGKGLAAMPRKARGEALEELREHIMERAKEIGGGTADESSICKAITEIGTPEEVASGYCPQEPHAYSRGALGIIGVQGALAVLAAVVFAAIMYHQENFGSLVYMLGSLVVLSPTLVLLAIYVIEAIRPGTIPLLKDVSLVLAVVVGIFLYFAIPEAFKFGNRKEGWVSDSTLLGNQLIYSTIMVFYIGCNVLGWWHLGKYHIFPQGTPKGLKSYLRNLKKGLAPLDFASKRAIMEEVREHAVSKLKEYSETSEADKVQRFISEFGSPTEVAMRYLSQENWVMSRNRRFSLAGFVMIGSFAMAFGCFIGITIISHLGNKTVSPFGVVSSMTLMTVGAILIYLSGTLLSRPLKSRDYWHTILAMGFVAVLLLSSAAMVTTNPRRDNIRYEYLVFHDPLFSAAAKDDEGNLAVFWVDKVTSDSFSYGEIRNELFMTKYDMDGKKLMEKKISGMIYSPTFPVSVRYANGMFHLFFDVQPDGSSYNYDSQQVLQYDKDGNFIRGVNINFNSQVVPLSTALPPSEHAMKYRIQAEAGSLVVLVMKKTYLGNDTYRYALEKWPTWFGTTDNSTWSGDCQISTPISTTDLFTVRERSLTVPERIEETMCVDIVPGEKGCSVVSNHIISVNTSYSQYLNYVFIDQSGEKGMSTCLLNYTDDGMLVYTASPKIGSFSHDGNPGVWMIWNSPFAVNVFPVNLARETVTNLAIVKPLENISVVNSLSSHDWGATPSQEAVPFLTEYPAIAQVGQSICFAYPVFMNDKVPRESEPNEYNPTFNASASSIYLTMFGPDGAIASNEKIRSLPIETDRWFPWMILGDETQDGKMIISWMEVGGAQSPDNGAIEAHVTEFECDGTMLAEEITALTEDEWGFLYPMGSGISGIAMPDGSFTSMQVTFMDADELLTYYAFNEGWRNVGDTQVPELRFTRFTLDGGLSIEYTKVVNPAYNQPNDFAMMLSGIVIPIAAVALAQAILNWRRAAAPVKKWE